MFDKKLLKFEHIIWGLLFYVTVIQFKNEYNSKLDNVLFFIEFDLQDFSCTFNQQSKNKKKINRTCNKTIRISNLIHKSSVVYVYCDVTFQR